MENKNERYISNEKPLDFRKLKFLLLGGDDDFTIMKRMIGTGVSLDDLIYLGKFNDPKQGKGKVYYNNTEGDYSLQKDAIDEIKSKLSQ